MKPVLLDDERMAFFKDRANCYDAVHPGELLAHIAAQEEELKALRLIRERMSLCRLGSLGMSPQESMNFSSMMNAVSAYDMFYRK